MYAHHIRHFLRLSATIQRSIDATASGARNTNIPRLDLAALLRISLLRHLPISYSQMFPRHPTTSRMYDI